MAVKAKTWVVPSAAVKVNVLLDIALNRPNHGAMSRVGLSFHTPSLAFLS